MLSIRMPLSNTGQMPNRVSPIKLDIQVSQPEDLDIYWTRCVTQEMTVVIAQMNQVKMKICH